MTHREELERRRAARRASNLRHLAATIATAGIWGVLVWLPIVLTRRIFRR